MSRQLPPAKCAMCSTESGLHLQYKVGDRKWTDAGTTLVDGRKAYRVSKLSTCLRWLCAVHWNQHHGKFGLTKIEEQTRKFWDFRKEQNKINTNPKRVLD